MAVGREGLGGTHRFLYRRVVTAVSGPMLCAARHSLFRCTIFGTLLDGVLHATLV